MFKFALTLVIGFLAHTSLYAQEVSSLATPPQLTTGSKKNDIVRRLEAVNDLFTKVLYTETARARLLLCHAWDELAKPDWSVDARCTTGYGALLLKIIETGPSCWSLLETLNDPKSSEKPWGNERSTTLYADWRTLKTCEAVLAHGRRVFPKYTPP